MAEQTKYLIIGNSAGGIGAAEALRTADPEGSITIVSEEPYPAYSRPMIAKYLSKNITVDDMLFRSPDFYQKNHVTTIEGQAVTALDIDAHTATLANGSSLEWKKLLMATGSAPIIPPIPGSDRKGVFTFLTLKDAMDIKTHIAKFKRNVRAVVIGGGLIGVSVTEALTRLQVKVTMVEMKDALLNTIMDTQMSDYVADTLTAQGIEVCTGHTASEISGYLQDEVTAVILDNGRSIPCELVVLALGVRPRTELVRDSAVATARGIITDAAMKTTSDDVYACGDVAEVMNFTSDEQQCIPVWPGAYIGGKVAGINMAGGNAVSEGFAPVNSINYFGMAIASAGIVNPTDSGYEILSEGNGADYKKVVLKDNRIVGFIMSGNIATSGIIYNLMKEKRNVEDFKTTLISDNFGLLSLPADMRAEKIGVVQ